MTDFEMPEPTHTRWLNACMASCQKSADILEGCCKGRGPSERDQKISRIASVLVCEIAVEEIQRQGRLVVARVLNRNEIAEHFTWMKRAMRGLTLTLNIIEDRASPLSMLERTMKLAYLGLKAVDDMHETGISYESDSGRKKVYILQNTAVQRFVLELITAIAHHRKHIEQQLPDLYRELCLVCRRLNKAADQVSGFDSTPIDAVEPER